MHDCMCWMTIHLLELSNFQIFITEYECQFVLICICQKVICISYSALILYALLMFSQHAFSKSLDTFFIYITSLLSRFYQTDFLNQQWFAKYTKGNGIHNTYFSKA